MALPKSAPSNDILGLESLLLGTNRYPKSLETARFVTRHFANAPAACQISGKGARQYVPLVTILAAALSMQFSQSGQTSSAVALLGRRSEKSASKLKAPSRCSDAVEDRSGRASGHGDGNGHGIRLRSELRRDCRSAPPRGPTKKAGPEGPARETNRNRITRSESRTGSAR